MSPFIKFMPPKKRTRRKLALEESDGAKAWRSHYRDLFERYLDLHDNMKTICGLFSMKSYDEAEAFCASLLARFDHEEETLTGP